LVDAENKERKPDFFDVLVVAELGGMIIELLIPSIGDLTALAMTSKLARACVRCHFVRLVHRPIYTLTGNTDVMFRTFGTSGST
jgi:hypothetical protein